MPDQTSEPTLPGEGGAPALSGTALLASGMTVLPVSGPGDVRDWVAVLQAAPAHILSAVGAVVAARSDDLATVFYRTMMADPEASRFLSHTSVQTRLHASIQRWMQTLFGGDHDQFAAMAALQRQVGEVHARADIPVHLVARGMRLLKARLFEWLVQSDLSRLDLLVAAQYVSSLMELAFAEMSGAYVASHEQGARADEMFRMVTAGQNAALERHRQLAALTEWENTVLRALATGAPVASLPGLRSSAFGLWVQHKGPLLFADVVELAGIFRHIERLDHTLLPLIAQEQRRQSAPLAHEPGNGLRDFVAELEECRFLVNAMFDRLSDLEAGRDVLTQLYNRRFLPTIMRRALLLARRQENSFGILMLDVDHFKRVNDDHGHEMGDRVLQSVAGLLMSHGRASDFYFRYGGEEFLAVLNEVTETELRAVAEKIRSRIAATEIPLSEGKSIRITISIGAAMHIGHPDYRQLINRADTAMYEAKHTGRNRVCLAPG